jgi:uncharacterized protein (UPF0332 family)
VILVDIDNDRDQNDLRDFHHSVYYAAFFVARYALIMNDEPDCSEHKEVPAKLGTLGPNGSLVRQQAIQLQTQLVEWQEARNVADYIMSDQRLAPLAQQGVIQGAKDMLDNLFMTWGVP